MRQRALSFTLSLTLNLVLVGSLCLIRFETPLFQTERAVSRSILITPAPPRLPLKPPRAPRLRFIAPLVASPVRLGSPFEPPPQVETRYTPESSMAAPRFAVPPPPPAVVTGTFQAPAVLPAQTHNPALTLPAAGFATAITASRGSSGSAIATGGFESAGAASGSVHRQAAPAEAGFQAVQIASPKHQDAPVTISGTFHSVEILNKPKPDYTEEARQKRVEGEVWLEVLFAADGTPHVRHVLRSLGFGLDENAIRAARLIRFRPAREGSHEVDQVATVRVQFQLAE